MGLIQLGGRAEEPQNLLKALEFIEDAATNDKNEKGKILLRNLI